MKNPKNPVIQNDMMRYKRNKLPGNLILLSLVFECFYFLVMYKQTCDDIIRKFADGTPVYTYQMGISVVLNLALLLSIFLSSEEVKGYNKKFCIVVWVIAAIQLVRIAGYPITTYNAMFKDETFLFEIDTLLLLIIGLAGSAGCLIAGGVLGFININRLEKYKKDLESGAIDLDAELAAGDALAGEPVEEATASAEEVENA